MFADHRVPIHFDVNVKKQNEKTTNEERTRIDKDMDLETVTKKTEM